MREPTCRLISCWLPLEVDAPAADSVCPHSSDEVDAFRICCTTEPSCQQNTPRTASSGCCHATADKGSLLPRTHARQHSRSPAECC